MKIVFVCPDWTEDLGVFSGLAKKRNSQPPLGILYLASVALKKRHEVRVIDADVEGYSVAALIKEIIAGGFDMVGITATSPIFYKASSLARGLKAQGFRFPVLIGGEHINIFRDRAFEDCFDYGFFGESEKSFGEFLEVIETGRKDLSRIKGLIYRKGVKTAVNPEAERIQDLDTLDFPAMHLLKNDRYRIAFAKFRPRKYLSIMATRGCPFKCVYCSEPLTNPQVRFRSAGNVVDEIEKWVKDLKIRHYFFMDSNLTLNKEQTEGICNEIIRRGLKITFEGWTRANLVDRQILALMKKAGLIRMSYGIESGDPEILRIIGKEVSREDMLNAFRITDELGIESVCSMMLGLPGETRASVEKTISFVSGIPQMLYSNFSIANPYPGTKMHQWAREGKYGMRLLTDDFSEYRRYDYSPVAVNDLSAGDLIYLQKVGLVRMHLRPKRMWAVVKIIGFWEIVIFLIRLIIKSGRGPKLASKYSERDCP